MEHKLSSVKLFVTGAVAALLLANCSTYYDAQGRPVQAIDPVAATVGAVAVGAIAYAAGDNNGSYRRYHRGGYHRGGFGRGGRGRGRY